MTSPVRIVATFDQYDASWEHDHIAEFTDLAVDVQSGAPLTTDEFIAVGRGADALLIDAREPITDSLLDQLPGLKVIGRHSVGLDNIDLDAATLDSMGFASAIDASSLSDVAMSPANSISDAARRALENLGA